MIDEGRAVALVRGVAANPGAGAGVLVRLLPPEAREAREVLQRRPLPAEFVALVLRDGDRSDRSVIARNVHLTGEQARQVVRDRDDLVAARLVSAPGGRGTVRAVQLPDDVVDLVLLGTAERDRAMLLPQEIVAELGAAGHLEAHLRRLVDHPEPALRAFVCGYWTRLGTGQRAALLADPDPEVRAAAHREAHPDLAEQGRRWAANSSRDRITQLWASPLPDDLLDTLITTRTHPELLAGNPHLPPPAVRRLAADPDPLVRRTVAQRPDLDAELLDVLAADPDEGVRRRAALLPAPRTRGRAEAVFRVLGTPVAHPSAVRPEPVDDPGLDWYRACAAAPDPVLRRTAATCPRLDPPTAARLAADPDRDVRLLLALHHPAAPPALLLEAYAQLPEQRDRLRLHPAFPRRGLPAALARDPDPAVRELAASDQDFAGDPEALRADPDPRVRRAAAANPRLPAGRAADLLADPGAGLEQVEGAAAHPGLTADRLHALLDEAGVPRARTRP
ncbi:hypothetical protein ACIQBJ_04405 [Kitasatospora sp. NPDC088391]|uniref:hypothetical protein n=1 Tax=Kitasatospora sp. NPDC088391 TaxID=3364074 RepID=UPI00382DCDEB